MEAIEQDQVIEAFAQRIMENLNMVYAEAADRKRPFANADARFAELFQLLRYYRCDEIAAEQAVNFAQIAFFRGEYLRALELFGNALESCTRITLRRSKQSSGRCTVTRPPQTEQRRPKSLWRSRQTRNRAARSPPRRKANPAPRARNRKGVMRYRR